MYINKLPQESVFKDLFLKLCSCRFLPHILVGFNIDSSTTTTRAFQKCIGTRVVCHKKQTLWVRLSTPYLETCETSISWLALIQNVPNLKMFQNNLKLFKCPTVTEKDTRSFQRGKLRSLIWCLKLLKPCRTKRKGAARLYR